MLRESLAYLLSFSVFQQPQSATTPATAAQVTTGQCSAPGRASCAPLPRLSTLVTWDTKDTWVTWDTWPLWLGNRGWGGQSADTWPDWETRWGYHCAQQCAGTYLNDLSTFVFQDLSVKTNEDNTECSNLARSVPDCEADLSLNDSSDLSKNNICETILPAKKSVVCSIL